MARPIGKWFVSSGLSNLRKRIRPFGCAVGQDGDPRILILIKGPASSAIFRQGFQNADRLSGHLPLNHTQTSAIAARARRSIGSQARIAAAS